VLHPLTIIVWLNTTSLQARTFPLVINLILDLRMINENLIGFKNVFAATGPQIFYSHRVHSAASNALKHHSSVYSFVTFREQKILPCI
jgi:hypothetical protein